MSASTRRRYYICGACGRPQSGPFPLEHCYATGDDGRPCPGDLRETTRARWEAA